MTTTWYGKSPAKQLQILLQSKPNLLQLLSIASFTTQLKSYNPKLLQYISSNPSLIKQLIDLIIISPNQYDTQDRKYKYPLQAVQIVETETTCIVSGFFKEYKTEVIFDFLFNIAMDKQVLPLLAGYYFRVNICLLNNKYKQCIERVYNKPNLLKMLLNHAHLMPIINTLQLYLNLDVNKSSESNPSHLQRKKQIFYLILNKINQEQSIKSLNSSLIIQNLISLLIQTIQKYYLILDGKALIQILTQKNSIEIMMRILQQKWENSSLGFNFFISIINYYSFSSFNSQQSQVQKRSLVLARLQSQPLIQSLTSFFPKALSKILQSPTFTLHNYHLLQILCHCISISSQSLFLTIKSCKFFQALIGLMFKYEQNNVLHMLIEKSFLHVFISQRKIYQQYKSYLFTEVDIIHITVGRVISMYEEHMLFQQFKKKVYFGHFMRILKIYSGIQTTQEAIINAIKAKTDVWNKISTLLIKPYQTICYKQLGSYSDLPQGKFQQFQLKPLNSQLLPLMNPKPLTRSMIQQIRKQDQFLPSIKQSSQPQNHQQIIQKQREQQLLRAPIHNLSTEFKGDGGLKKVESFKDFMSKKKVQAEQQIKLKRSLSHEKKLSGSKGKMTSQSPKKNSWTQSSTNEKQLKNLSTIQSLSTPPPPTLSKPPLPLTSNRPPRLSQPIQYNSYYSNQSNNTTSKSQPNDNLHKSYSVEDRMVQAIRKIKVIQIQTPKDKKFRRVEDKDHLLLEFLGIINNRVTQASQ